MHLSSWISSFSLPPSLQWLSSFLLMFFTSSPILSSCSYTSWVFYLTFSYSSLLILFSYFFYLWCTASRSLNSCRFLFVLSYCRDIWIICCYCSLIYFFSCYNFSSSYLLVFSNFLYSISRSSFSLYSFALQSLILV